jgi:long-chain acyl-CoA synthetase
MNAFRWHPEARLIGPDGVAQGPLPAGDAIIADRPAVRALALALARGQGFRIGGTGDVVPAGFETLTGGSSGAPRRVRRSAASWQASFAVNAGLFGIGPGVRVGIPGRLSHSLALYGALEGMHLGAEVHLLDGLRADRMAQALAGCAVIYATPAQLRMLVGVPWPGLRHLVVGGSKLDRGLRAILADLAPQAQVTEFYGAAETSFITMSDAGTPEGSVGRAYPGVEIRVDAGEVWVRSPYLCDGYAAGGPARWHDGWLTVGEYGRLEGGYLFLQGRAGRMVTVADQNVFMEEVEAWLAGLPGVVLVSVVARADTARGHVLEAVIMGDQACEADILRAARAHLGVLRAPRRIWWRKDWPQLASGKTDLVAIERDLH